MTRLLTIAFPVLDAGDAAWIDAFRQRHDAQRRPVVAAHYTLVFGCSGVGLEAYTAHVAGIAATTQPVDFECRYAMLGADDEDDSAYVFLVPDQGSSRLALLHDHLYTGPLQPFLRLDLPYVPHITIGHSRDRIEAKAWCDGLNARGVRVAGAVRELAVGTVRDGVFETLSTHVLGAGSSTA